MRIEIHPETAEEKAQLPDPWIRGGVQRFGLSGRMDPAVSQFEFGFSHGLPTQVKADILRFLIDLDAAIGSQSIVQGVLQAHGIMAEHIKSQRIAAELRNGGGPRLVRE